MKGYRSLPCPYCRVRFLHALRTRRGRRILGGGYALDRIHAAIRRHVREVHGRKVQK